MVLLIIIGYKKYEKGMLTYPDGTKYEGDWVNDKKQGFGVGQTSNP
ncbi:hypothetical protein AGMMS49949_00980 [Alphaproteobacteria bacterium]|nr:hypothetical protein AGMMS49949_00980 [Alphaproteobacteria bacterium]GHS96254.1 hypothetical protein AGMMS50296_2250 [Alphaproteobacteria bacterium]